MSPARVKVVVAVPTFQRPEALRRLLGMLPEHAGDIRERAEVRVIVIDNDPAGSARTIVRDACPDLRVHYVVEPRPGIAAARERALVEAVDDEVLCFVDDDEIPRRGWLEALLRTWLDTGACAVMGRVISVFGSEPDPWLIATGVFRRRPRPTGMLLPSAAAGNLLLDLRQVRALDVHFDARLGLGAGEDVLFSRGIVRRGGRIVWCNESEVEDLVPPSRMTRAWAMSRAYNGGHAAVVVDLLVESSTAARARVRARYLVGGLARNLLGLLRHLQGRALRNLEADARGLRTSYRGRGMMSAAVGRSYAHYARGEEEQVSPRPW